MNSNPDVPPFTGYVETTVNALRLIHAARQGVIPRITRRLNDSERRTMIKSGAVFVFSVEESGIKRWTDGLLWSPSRIVGNFLVYREINERSSSRGSHKKPYPSEELTARSLVRKGSPDQIPMGYKSHGADQGTFKPGGLIKKTITVTIEGSDLHLISYYTSDDIRSGKLKRPSTRSDIMNLYMPPHIFRLTNFRVPPKVDIGPDGKPRLVETEEVEVVDCKVEDSAYNIPSSPTWSSQGSPTSPTEAPFGASSLYPVQGNSGGNAYARSSPSERWQSESLLSPLQRHDVPSWSHTGAASAVSLARRREGSIVQSDTWPPIHSQSSRSWQGGAQDSVQSSTVGSPGMYQDRQRVRQASNQYDHTTHALHRRDEGNTVQSAYSVRYTPHPTATREGALQRLHWHTRDNTDVNRDLRRSTTGTHTYSSSPNVPFTAAGYSTPTYTSTWTSPDALLSTPTLHSISNQTNISYDGAYPHASNSIVSSPDEYAAVEEYRES